MSKHKIPVYRIEPNEPGGSRHFKMYNFKGDLPKLSDLLIPHRKDHYLIVFTRRSGSRQWIDMVPYTLQKNRLYFSGPENVVVKEELQELWSTGIAFTSEFLSLHDGAELIKLPVIRNPHNAHELLLTEADVTFIEDILTRLNAEHQNPGEWQQRMLVAYIAVLLTYMSRLYTAQYKSSGNAADKRLLRSFLAHTDKHFRELREVSDYASLMHISAGYLGELVKEQSGKPAIKHIHDRIVLEARRLLLHTNDPIKEIAFDLGFADTSYFNRFFKRETGTTPAGYRGNIRKMYH